MRFLETLLLVCVVVYVAQLIIATLILAMLMLFLLCLWKRPREALMLGLAVLLVAFISKPIGMLLVAAGIGTLCCLAALRWLRARRARLMLTYRLPSGEDGDR